MDGRFFENPYFVFIKLYPFPIKSSFAKGFPFTNDNFYENSI